MNKAAAAAAATGCRAGAVPAAGISRDGAAQRLRMLPLEGKERATRRRVVNTEIREIVMDGIDSVMRLAANILWFVSCFPGFIRFQYAVRFPRQTQNRCLRRILKRKPGVGHPPPDVRALPCTDYEAYRGDIERVINGRPHTLTCEKVTLLEPTSGSSSAPKLIPVTPLFRKELRKAINPWIASLYLSNPSLLMTSQYWSVSPSTPLDAFAGSRVPVGFDADTGYLSALQQVFARFIMSVPSAIHSIGQQECFLYATARLLAADRNLGLISVWHPSFLIIIAETIRRHYAQIVGEIAEGKRGAPLCDGEYASIEKCVRPLPRRAAELERIDISRPDAFNRLWPRLRVISCWTEGSASMDIDALRVLFPRCSIQPKGLIATEAIVSIPIGMTAPGVCAVGSHYLEFIDCETADIVPLHKLRCGRRYSVVVTTGNGFVRYRLGDIVETVGFYCRTPRLRFIAREGVVVDCVGEKISVFHAETVRERLYRETNRGFTFFMLSPLRETGRWRYGLFVQFLENHTQSAADLAARCDTLLAENYHYAHARRLGQLGPLRLFRIESGADEAYISYHIRRGMKRGDIKFSPLHGYAGWEKLFQGCFITD